MALLPGSEAIPHDASPAFLAGHAHGAQLAVQHAAKPAAPAKSAAPKKVAAPAQTLLQQAQAIAQAQTDAQVKAIQGQQDAYRQQALERAQQIQAASQASAGILNGWDLGGATANSYDNAAKTIGGLAQGFSGQTGVDATNAANDVQANLAALGAPQGGAKTSTGQVSDPAALKNVLYGLGGFIPGNLLETSGQAAAAVQRGLPASTLAYGQQQAAGTVAAGAQQADTLTPQLLDAQGKLPTLVQQALSSLNTLQNTAFNQRFKVGQANEHIDEFNANQKLKVANHNLAMTKAQWQQSNADRSYGLSYNRYVLAEQKAAQIKANGGLSVSQQNLLAGKVQDFTKGLYQGVPGHVTYPSATNSLTAPRIDSWKQKPTSYQQAIKTLIARYPSLGASGAIQAADSLYQPGEGGRPKTPVDLTAQGLQGPGLGVQTKVTQVASKYLGVPYQWGGTTTKGLDCSAFIQQVYKQLGVQIPRTTYAQVKAGQGVTLDQIQPGDAIYTEPGKNGPNHVGLYIGNGMVQESPHTGDVNKIISLKDFLTGGFVAARRFTP